MNGDRERDLNKGRPLFGRLAQRRSAARRPAAKPPSERQRDALTHELMNKRPCGACQACCVAVAVREIDKGMGTPCSHQCAGGCGIYRTRPESCRSYACAWKIGWIPGSDRPGTGGLVPATEAEWAAGAEFRPDRLRMILDIDKAKGDDKGPGRLYIRAWQLDHPTQLLDDRRAAVVAYQLASKLAMPVVAYYGTGTGGLDASIGEGAATSVHLIPALGMWTGAFRRRFPRVPVYPLYGHMGDNL